MQSHYKADDMQKTIYYLRLLSIIGVVLGVCVGWWTLAIIGILPILFFMLASYIALFPSYTLLLGVNLFAICFILFTHNYFEIHYKYLVFFFIETALSLGVIYMSYQDWKSYKFENQGMEMFYPNIKRYKNFDEYYRYVAYPEIVDESKMFWIIFLGRK